MDKRYNEGGVTRCIRKSQKCMKHFTRLLLRRQIPRKVSRRAKMWRRESSKWWDRAQTMWRNDKNLERKMGRGKH